MTSSGASGISRQSFDQQAADWLRDAIVSGRLAPGQRLTEAALASETGVSRSTTRTALLHVAAEGLVVRQAYSGWSVAELSAEDAWELYTLRKSLDGIAARLAAEKIDDEGRQRLRQDFDRIVACCSGSDRLGLAQADVGFHSTIVDLTRHRRLRRQYDLILGATLLYVSNTNIRSSPEVITEGHRQICDAICAGEEALAQTLAESHVEKHGIALMAELGEKAESAAALSARL
ncbi:transcriptional regulator, GntR family protein (plasmid) [Rhodococcus jostii RHA1]|uniref:Transcriptional regulator, GntR family protein n=1 Tax=Rhodococcus jostii (strain RHA1) TaxID=101510 RepID=Q0RXT9_RHOJR|nr:GntR family transcriptional regulator [Rhodococcus jostii]ABG99897.1 transcriptional regulator, GntR family protein [Rhodococcus jostii RHA1]